MKIEEAIVVHAKDNTELFSLVGSRFKPSRLDQGTPYPAIVYERISTDPDFVHSGPSGFELVRFQFNCYASTFSQVTDVADALVKAFAGFRGLMGSTGGVQVFSVQQYDRDDGWNDEMSVYESRVDLGIEFAK